MTFARKREEQGHMNIARAVLLPMDEAGEAGVRAFAPDRTEAQFFSSVAEKILSSDAGRATRPLEGGEQARLLAGFARRPFAEAALVTRSDLREQRRTLREHIAETEAALAAAEEGTAELRARLESLEERLDSMLDRLK